MGHVSWAFCDSGHWPSAIREGAGMGADTLGNAGRIAQGAKIWRLAHNVGRFPQ